ncbi:hypothetical protein KEM48_014092 [Puccinia striiformis f. sp. tritici PST-130]|nr:hypothetical protein KEM48_014092 [Puccinia striiformis f. sp. tritici PST-130]
MEPADRFKDNGTTLDQISHLQSELDHTLHQIVSLVAVVRRRTLSSPANTDDQHLKELKGFRAQGLQSESRRPAHDCSQLIQLSKLSPQQHMCHDRATERKAEVARWVTQVVVMIDMDVKWLTAHEIHQIQEDWEGYVPGITDVGESVYNVIKLIKKILSEFEINMCLVVRYVLPLMPNQVAHPSSQNPLKTGGQLEGIVSHCH